MPTSREERLLPSLEHTAALSCPYHTKYSHRCCLYVWDLKIQAVQCVMKSIQQGVKPFLASLSALKDLIRLLRRSYFSSSIQLNPIRASQYVYIHTAAEYGCQSRSGDHVRDFEQWRKINCESSIVSFELLCNNWSWLFSFCQSAITAVNPFLAFEKWVIVWSESQTTLLLNFWVDKLV